MSWASKSAESLSKKAKPQDLALKTISLRGAREHNLKNINVDIPRGQLVIITGVSGSGKSSLAFDTLFAEGQRRYVESLSAYARQFISQLEKPDLDVAEGLSPAIAIEQKTANHNPRSTVGTVTELYDHLRLLFARVGKPHCPDCKEPIVTQNLQSILERVLSLPTSTPVIILAPIVRGRKGLYNKELDECREAGFSRVRVDGVERDLAEDIQLSRQKSHTIEVVVDRLKLKEGVEARLQESLEVALKLTQGFVRVETRKAAADTEDIQAPEPVVLDFNQKLACLKCGRGFPEIEPRFFSFNSAYGACVKCNGLGFQQVVDPSLLVPDPEKSLKAGAVEGMEPRFRSYFIDIFTALAEHFGGSVDAPFKDLPQKLKEAIFYGAGNAQIKFSFSRGGRGKRRLKQKFMGIVPYLERRYREAETDDAREGIEVYMESRKCPECHGARLRPEALAVHIAGQSIAQLAASSIGDCLKFFAGWKPTAREELIAERVLKEIRERLGFLLNVGVNYLSLDRGMSTLSGGEAQRVRLATQLGSQLVGVLYVLDEPSIGLHPRDHGRLLQNLKRLRDAGNSVVVVEHDEDTMRQADYLIDMGPGAGRFGGEVIFSGTPQAVEQEERSLTGDYLSGRRKIEVPKTRKKPERFLTIRGAATHNLKEIDVDIPLGVFVCVTGVSGSGKSTLVKDTLYEWFRQRLYGWRRHNAPAEAQLFRSIEGEEFIDKVVHIDQKPIGRSPRSNPATYTGLFSFIREVFARLPEARVRGWKPGRFSFNVKGGRCEACQGAGMKKIEMHFLPDTYVRCEVCEGKRYERETLKVRYRGLNIAEVLGLSVGEAVKVFENIPWLARSLQMLMNVGLEYISLGQAATTLSGGEAQRLKLTRELGKRGTGKTLFILDEPTTGLHFADIHHLLEIFKRLVEAGNTVLVIEHNLEVVKSADYLIDLGPEGGEEGGRIVAIGTPEEVARIPESLTGQYLRGRL